MGRPSKLPLIVAELKSATGKARGLTQVELQHRCHVSVGGVSKNIAQLHDEGRAYVCGWVTDNPGPHQALWKLGNAPDVPRPPPLTRAEVSRRFRERAIKTGLVEDIRAKGRAYWWRKQPPRRDPLAAALFGSPGAA